MLRALLDRFGTTVSFDGHTLQAIWSANALDDVTEDELRALKIGYRARILKRISAQFSSMQVDELALRACDTEHVRTLLMSLYGVGPETVRILLTETFHRDTALDHIAPWQQKIYSRLLYRRAALVPTPKIISFARRRFGQQAALAVHYIWEDLFWRHREQPIDWLTTEIRL
jgi:N-glycosylase/DNA lyase